MKLINPYYKIIKQEPGLSGIYKAIEQAGRTCYKSEDKITAESAKDFVNRMIKSGHNAMLEFGTIYLKCPIAVYGIEGEDRSETNNPLEWFLYNPYSTGEEVWNKKAPYDEGYCYITTNYRVLIENNRLEDLKYLCEPTEHHEKRICVKFITDRGISHELVRHRVFSFAQESTRYCNYSKDKFRNEITCILPPWLDIGLNSEVADCFKRACEEAEYYYFKLLKEHRTPQEARQVLPNALKTEINMCGFTSDWEHFFYLRDNIHAHPDMQVLAKDLHDQFVTTKYI